MLYIYNYEKEHSKKCDHLVKYLGFTLYDNDHPFIGAIVNKWCSHGNLSDYSRFIYNRLNFFRIEEFFTNKNDTIYKDPIYENLRNHAELLNLALQIAKAMDFLNNTLKIIHRDLKGANVFLDMRMDGKLLAKVGDFDISLTEIKKLWPNHLGCTGTKGFMVRL